MKKFSIYFYIEENVESYFPCFILLFWAIASDYYKNIYPNVRFYNNNEYFILETLLPSHFIFLYKNS